eukprot:TRINITY_DN2596_c0_g1_i1.p1 TRINITY_DN2596_c0_g1~~TRINITY_DN2596_c0_g1_i1.p1  ORF type:complete len:224 (+),score=65.77 TRINITY_DN2596_c0_g1_i1:67-672(+)
MRDAGLAVVLAALCSACAQAFVCLPAPAASTMTMSLQTSRVSFIRTVGGAAAAAVAIATPWQAQAVAEITTASGLKIKKLAEGKGEQCAAGDLAAVRFKGRYKDFEFDNIFDTEEPLYVRAGGGFLVKGLDEAMVMMRIGDRWELTIPGALGFGEKGRSPSPGKPRIPPNATLVYEMELTALPGKEGELFEALEDVPTVDE